MADRGLLRAVRVAVFSLVCVVLAATGHALAGGHRPPLALLALGGTAVAVTAGRLADRERTLGQIVCAVTVTQGALHLLFAFDTVQSGQGVGNEFLYIIAAVIGGCLLTGGYGTAVGAFIGAFIFGMTNQGIVYAGWNPDWFKFFLGAMLLFAVIANNSFRNYAAKR